MCLVKNARKVLKRIGKGPLARNEHLLEVLGMENSVITDLSSSLLAYTL